VGVAGCLVDQRQGVIEAEAVKGDRDLKEGLLIFDDDLVLIFQVVVYHYFHCVILRHGFALDIEKDSSLLRPSAQIDVLSKLDSSISRFRKVNVLLHAGIERHIKGGWPVSFVSR